MAILQDKLRVLYVNTASYGTLKFCGLYFDQKEINRGKCMIKLQKIFLEKLLGKTLKSLSLEDDVY